MSPSNGAVALAPTGIPFQYRLTYTPNANFEGLNNFTVVVFPLELSNFSLVPYRITVTPVIIRAEHDLARTTAGQAITIPVMANDYSSTGLIQLRATPVANAGTARIVGDQIEFTPSPGFYGLTDFNYVVCTNQNKCAVGTVSVYVLPTTTANTNDTIQVFTKKGKPQLVLAPDNYLLQTPPANGSLETLNGVLRYIPNANFLGR
ncbi:MAG: hypothetical protein HC821_03825 [Lewinella sp.]|nr:hypothetical protein [Lewinella sp.]